MPYRQRQRGLVAALAVVFAVAFAPAADAHIFKLQRATDAASATIRGNLMAERRCQSTSGCYRSDQRRSIGQRYTYSVGGCDAATFPTRKGHMHRYVCKGFSTFRVYAPRGTDYFWSCYWTVEPTWTRDGIGVPTTRRDCREARNADNRAS